MSLMSEYPTGNAKLECRSYIQSQLLAGGLTTKIAGQWQYKLKGANA